MKYTIVFFFIGVFGYAQTDTIHLLDEVKLYGNFSPLLNSGYQVQLLSDSVLNSRQQSLGNLLQNHANLYFKQNGNGMVSSISLRGSGASHTSVYWNGIAINSSLNGQTDFNTFSANGYNQIEIRKGGGGILFGSGAVGGAINLRDQIIFKNKFQSQMNLGIGSYNTQKVLVNSQYSTEKIHTKVVVEGNRSDNDFPYLGTDLHNDNGAYQNYHSKGVFAYKINQNNQIHFFATTSKSDRNLSRTLTAPNNSKLKNIENRLLVNWKNFGQSYNSSLRLAYLNEEYNFYFNKESSEYSFGKSDNYILKYDFKYFISKHTSLHTGLENKYSTANGSNLLDKHRNDFEIYAVLHKSPIDRLQYNVSLRKGLSSVYEIPLIYAADLRFQLSSKFNVKANFSTNYRLPSYNDLFWNPGGNPDLVAENSTSGELGIGYHQKNLSLNLSAYITKSKDLIQWRPETASFWRPVNVQDVESYGLEFEFKLQQNFGKHRFNLQSQYTYTVATDLELNKQLIYVPYHKATTTLNYMYKSFSINFNEQYTSKVFTTTSNTQTVNANWLSTIEIYKSFLKQKLTIGVLANNLWNTAYQSVAYRPMPNRNFEFNMNYKF